jgi:hypothetical protein
MTAAKIRAGNAVRDSQIMSRAEVVTIVDEALGRQAVAHAAAIAELQAVIQALSVAGASPNKPRFVALKRATFGKSDYENVRTWCTKGRIVARKEGCLWFVDMTSLEEYRAMRASR